MIKKSKLSKKLSKSNGFGKGLQDLKNPEKKEKQAKKSLDQKLLEVKKQSRFAFLAEQKRLKEKKQRLSGEKTGEKDSKEDTELEDIIKAIEDIQKQDKSQRLYKPIKTNYNAPAEIYESLKKNQEVYSKNVKPPKRSSEEIYQCEIKTRNEEQLAYEDIERITRQDIVNSILGLEKWNNISPHEKEDYENWRKLSPGAKIIWWSLVQNSGFGVKDIDCY